MECDYSAQLPSGYAYEEVDKGEIRATARRLLGAIFRQRASGLTGLHSLSRGRHRSLL